MDVCVCANMCEYVYVCVCVCVDFLKTRKGIYSHHKLSVQSAGSCCYILFRGNWKLSTGRQPACLAHARQVMGCGFSRGIEILVSMTEESLQSGISTGRTAEWGMRNLYS